MSISVIEMWPKFLNKQRSSNGAHLLVQKYWLRSYYLKCVGMGYFSWWWWVLVLFPCLPLFHTSKTEFFPFTQYSTCFLVKEILNTSETELGSFCPNGQTEAYIYLTTWTERIQKLRRKKFIAVPFLTIHLIVTQGLLLDLEAQIQRFGW